MTGRPEHRATKASRYPTGLSSGRNHGLSPRLEAETQLLHRPIVGVIEEPPGCRGVRKRMTTVLFAGYPSAGSASKPATTTSAACFVRSGRAGSGRVGSTLTWPSYRTTRKTRCVDSRLLEQASSVLAVAWIQAERHAEAGLSSRRTGCSALLSPSDAMSRNSSDSGSCSLVHAVRASLVASTTSRRSPTAGRCDSRGAQGRSLAPPGWRTCSRGRPETLALADGCNS